MCYCIFGVLGTLQIMVGLFNIGLGPGRESMYPGDLTYLGAAYWLGAVFIVSGIASIVPMCSWNCCTVVIAVILNCLSSIPAITGIVLYSVDMADTSFQWMCGDSFFSLRTSNGDCMQVAYFAQRMLTGMDITLIVMVGIQLWSNISLTVYGIFQLCCRMSKTGVNDVEIQQPLLKNILLSSSAA